MNKVKTKRVKAIYHESDEEMESGSFKTWYEYGSIPENKANNPKHLSLREGKQKICPNGGPVRLLQRSLQAFAVQSKTVRLSG